MCSSAVRCGLSVIPYLGGVSSEGQVEGKLMNYTHTHTHTHTHAQRQQQHQVALSDVTWPAAEKVRQATPLQPQEQEARVLML